MPDIAPAHDLILGKPDEWRLGAVEFVPDGRLYVDVWDQTLNLWNLLTYYWPEVAGGMLCLLVLVALIYAWRAKRRPQTVGEPHCAACNYHLVGVVGDTAGGLCPECGVDLGRRRPVVGRTLSRRVRLPVAVVVLGGMTYAGLVAIGVNRFVGRDALRWPAPRLAAWASEQRLHWITQRVLPTRSIVSIDPKTGRARRVLWGVNLGSAIGVSVSPDGKTLVTTLQSGELAAVDAGSGAVRHRYAELDAGKGASAPYAPDGWMHVAGWANPTNVLVQFWNSRRGHNELFRWDVASGDMTSVCHLTSTELQWTKPSLVYVAGLAGKGSGKGPLIGVERIELADYLQNDVVIRDLSDGGRMIRWITAWGWTPAEPLVAESTFVVRMSGGNVGVWSIAEGKFGGKLEVPGFGNGFQSGPAGIALDEARGRLFVATVAPCAVHVFDTEKQEWIGRLMMHEWVPDGDIAISNDGRWLATGATEWISMATGAKKEHLLVFDLSTLEKK